MFLLLSDCNLRTVSVIAIVSLSLSLSLHLCCDHHHHLQLHLCTVDAGSNFLLPLPCQILCSSLSLAVFNHCSLIHSHSRAQEQIVPILSIETEIVVLRRLPACL